MTPELCSRCVLGDRAAICYARRCDHPAFCKKVLAGHPGFTDHIRAKTTELAHLPPPTPRPARSAPFPPPNPPDGRIRLGIISLCCNLGGADLWVTMLLDWLDKHSIRPEGIVIVSPSIPIDPHVHADWVARCPVVVGKEAIRELGLRCDVMIAWGVFMSWGIGGSEIANLLPPGLPTICVSHGSLGDALIPRDEGFPGCIPAAVSHAALRGLPERLRNSAIIIPNGIEAKRIEVSRPRASMLAEWGLPSDAKIAGWLARMSPEKRPEVFVDALAMLPKGWFGVMAGSGHLIDEIRRYADIHAPGRVVILGPRHDVGDLLNAFDCLAMPTVSEACCLAASEAWAAAVPVISTKTGLLEEWPHLARLIPNPPTGRDLAEAILEDVQDVGWTRQRVESARSFAETTLGMDEFARSWTDLIRESAGPVVGPEICHCGDDVWVGSAKGCAEQHGKFDRVIHIWRDDKGGVRCRNAADLDGPRSLTIHWREYEPVEPLDLIRPGIEAVMEFAKGSGKLLVHCFGGVTRSTTLAVAAKVARGCRPAKAVADVRAAMLRDRKIPVAWHESIVAELVAMLEGRGDGLGLGRDGRRGTIGIVAARESKLDPQLISAVNACPHRSRSELPISEYRGVEAGCCMGPTRWGCGLGLGKVAGQPTLAYCLESCQAMPGGIKAAIAGVQPTEVDG